MLRKLVFAALLAVTGVITFVPTADADWRDRHWRRHSGPYYYTAPSYYYYAPPPVVYAPAPVYPGFSLNFGF